MKSKLLKGFFVVLGAVALSSIGLFAADSMQGIDRGLVGLAGSGAGLCRDGMTPVKNGEHSFCIDMYEASPGNLCAHSVPTNVIETEDNANAQGCTMDSKEGSEPWRFVSLTQAQRICAGAGKRLPTSDEWYAAALGTPHTECVISGRANPEKTGTQEACVSVAGAYDMIGNVWEWVDETVQDGTFANRQLPETGYVASVDASGVAITTAGQEQQLYGADYFWSKNEGTFGMIRGGFYAGEGDAGLYAINASVQTSFASPGLGFRCVEDML